MPVIANANEKQQEVFALLVDSILALQRENKEVLWGSMVKETMKRKKPSFNETYYGFRTFSHLLEDAQRRGIVVLRRDQKSGSYVVEDLGPGSVATSSRPEATTTAAPPPPPAPRLVEAAPAAPASQPETAEAGAASRPPRRRRSRGRKPRGASVLAAGAYIDPAAAHPADEGGDLGDDQDEGADDDHHEDAGAEMAEDAGGADAHSADSMRPGSADHDEGEERERALPASDPAQPERPAFSLFSWMKRDPVSRTSPAAEGEPPAGTTKPDPLE